MDINLFREDKGGNPELIRESQRRRFRHVETVDEIIQIDQEWRKARYQLDQAKKAFGKLNKDISEAKKKGDSVENLLTQVASCKGEIAKAENMEAEIKNKLDALLFKIGNIVHESVPVSQNEEDNAIIRTWGDKRKYDYTHEKLLYMIDGFDQERGARVADHRGYYLTGIGVFLNQAIISYALSFLSKKGYKTVQTPFFMRKDIMSKAVQLSQFDEELYKVVANEEKEYYLIATSEQPIAAMHMSEWIETKKLPIKYAGYSTCFRKEAGAHGKDVAGIFRVHQFEKIEQFVITDPHSSWEMHETMLSYSEEFLRSLELPYQVVCIISGELNDATAKKYDIECWFPGSQKYRELVSCSNCTDFQARRMDIRCGTKTLNKSQPFVHMLNSTLCATGRVICCLLENHQTDDGIRVPKVLQPFLAPYLENTEIIPYVNTPKNK